MAKKKGDIEHLDFDEYIHAGEPGKRERAYAWRTAIGLQAVDGLQVSDNLWTTARRNIEGEITIDEARDLIKTYYQSKTAREPDDDGKQEADRDWTNECPRKCSRKCPRNISFACNAFQCRCKDYPPRSKRSANQRLYPSRWAR